MLAALYRLIFGESASVLALRRELAAAVALRAADQLAAQKAAFLVEMRIVSSQASTLSPALGQRLEAAHQSDAELDAVLGAPLWEGAEDGALALAWGRACATLRGA